jgi:hypothetical protein
LLGFLRLGSTVSEFFFAGAQAQISAYLDCCMMKPVSFLSYRIKKLEVF